jgi:DNA-binding MarR family transcriptional regulator
VTYGQWKILTMLSREVGLTQKEIADRCELEGPTLLPIIDKMVVTRKVDREDRRINRISVSTRTDAARNSLVVSKLENLQYEIFLKSKSRLCEISWKKYRRT